jgi:hypothetical protein
LGGIGVFFAGDAIGLEQGDNVPKKERSLKQTIRKRCVYKYKEKEEDEKDVFFEAERIDTNVLNPKSSDEEERKEGGGR